ncbi:MAG TPA: hypothetical protein VK797_28700 [Tepidisphaeraceae bacterium]|jgi:hypothetical protein|nr:hypothetical protein [Tepidisphaeraceae bacterium]
MTRQRRRFRIGYAVWMAWTCLNVTAIWLIAARDQGPSSVVLRYGLAGSMVGCAALGLFGIVAFLRAEFAADQRLHRFSQGKCPQCAYSLTGNTSGVCPECGQPILRALDGVDTVSRAPEPR